MLKSIGRWIFIAIVIATVWKVFHGDVGAAVGTIGNFLINVIDSISDWVSSIPVVQSLFSDK